MPKQKIGAGCLTLAAGVILAFAVASPSIAAARSGRRSWMNRSLSAERRADLLIRAMTLDDKITMVHGVHRNLIRGYAGYVPPNPRLGIPALRLADGRAGVGNGATNVTLLPAPICAAASWDPSLLNAYGRVLGKKEWRKGTNVSLAPTIDVVRVPEWGRTFESYGEDPYFNGRMAAAEINGIQGQGPIANANMYLTMNQETSRFHQNSIVSERTLQEIYLPPFQAAVQAGHVGTVMCAYVKTNGTYSCENSYLLTDLLKKELGFDGWVMSDWGATHSTIAASNAGLDQEMPDGRYHGQALKAAVENGEVSVATLNTGGPVLMPWIGQVRGVIEAWYPGQEDGNAIAAILFGDVDPAGKLPLTFPRTASEIPTPASEQWPGVNGTSAYSEGLDAGYRWYDATGHQPLFPFGYGLSYTTLHHDVQE